ncbi:hypothetical protein N7451_005692 [Penicillium sp. IBT 35674x]|nr:hypothetical protein N7451_005692 [Penicillium sp. IBT 35674x]
MKAPTEILDQICFWAWIRGHQHSARSLGDDWQRGWAMAESRRDLASLRLVNKAFHASATPILFRHFDAKSKTTKSGKKSRLECLAQLSRNQECSRHVRHVDFGFDHFSNPASTRYVEELQEKLLFILQGLPRIKALGFHEPNSYMRREMGVDYMKIVAEALRRVLLPSLEQLVVKFPITYDFGLFEPEAFDVSHVPIEKILLGLQELQLYVCHLTDKGDRENSVIPFSSSSATLSNRTHALQLFRLLENVSSLQILVIKSANILDMDDVEWPSSMRLRQLTLEGISVSSYDLLNVLAQSANTLEEIDFCLVHLKTGSWVHVLFEMRNIPHLIDIVVRQCGYSATGLSSYMAFPFIPGRAEQYTFKGIESLNAFDNPALEYLFLTVNGNRTAAGYPEFPESKFEGINTMPWKSIIEHSQEIGRFAEELIPYLPEEPEDELDEDGNDDDGFWENIWA